jgi:hypothetical protein
MIIKIGNKMKYKILITSLLLLLTTHFLFSQAIKVTVAKGPNGWQLMRDNKPYYIKGAGGQTFTGKVVEIGGNSIRTWGLEQADEALAEAQKKGLTVMLGMWVQHERHGFDYNNKAAVQKQLEGFRKAVLKYKDHPALLMWGVGNEVDLNYSNTKVWDAIQDIAKMIHELDPNHPTSTVTAGLDGAEVKLIKEKAPDIDIYGINTYGDVGNVKENLRKFGWDGPYMITEWGPNGHWEVQKTQWGAAIEQTSKEKADSYANRYTQYIAADSAYCIGSYVFLWGYKQEYTATWYGMFMKDGKSTETVDALERVWTNKKIENPCPSLLNVSLNGKKPADNIRLKAQDMNEAEVQIAFEGKGGLVYNWEILRESDDKKEGGDAEREAEAITGLFRTNGEAKVKFRAPTATGQYRLFITVTNKGKAAYANIPFYVSPRDANDKPAFFVQPKVYDIKSFSTNE